MWKARAFSPRPRSAKAASRFSIAALAGYTAKWSLPLTNPLQPLVVQLLEGGLSLVLSQGGLGLAYRSLRAHHYRALEFQGRLHLRHVNFGEYLPLLHTVADIDPDRTQVPAYAGV